jgi:hypothetical protein
VYSWLWRSFPGGPLGKLVCTLVLVLGIAALLWFVVFPWIDPLLPFNDVTVQ